MFVTILGFLLAATLSSSAPVDFLAPQTLPAGCRLEVITVQEEVEETKVEKVVCETEFRPTCTIKLEKDCKNVTRPACEVSEKMECVENTVSQCSFETRLGSTGEEEEIEVCRDIPIEDCQLVKEEKCVDGEVEEVEECDEKEVEECEIVPHEECHQVDLSSAGILISDIMIAGILISGIMIAGILITGILNPSPPGHCGAAKASGQTGAADCVRSRE